MDPDIIAPIGFFVVIAVIIKMVLDYKTRRRLIEKGSVDENMSKMLAMDLNTFGLSSLKWGMVLVGIGLAVLLGELFPYDISGEMTLAIMMIFAGGGMLVYYIIAPAIRKKHIDDLRS